MNFLNSNSGIRTQIMLPILAIFILVESCQFPLSSENEDLTNPIDDICLGDSCVCSNHNVECDTTMTDTTQVVEICSFQQCLGSSTPVWFGLLNFDTIINHSNSFAEEFPVPELIIVFDPDSISTFAPRSEFIEGFVPTVTSWVYRSPTRLYRANGIMLEDIQNMGDSFRLDLMDSLALNVAPKDSLRIHQDEHVYIVDDGSTVFFFDITPDVASDCNLMEVICVTWPITLP